jgi:DNA-binding NtrC family response regulator
MATPMSILVIDDELEMAQLVADIARGAGHAAMSITAPALAMPIVEQRSIDLVITDVRMPGIDGIELIEQIKHHDPRIAIIAITAFGSIDTAVRAVRAGALDYLPKPFEPAALALAIENAVAWRSMTMELTRLRSEVSERFSFGGIIGKSQALADVAALARRVADASVTVLITGPSGSGKELVARALHGEGHRRGVRFVAVNCAAIPEALLESELFGVKKGAFTDARADRAGMFLEADGGTLFLDEIGDLALPLQAKLLRVLQEREVQPVGASIPEPIDVRVVAATNRDLRGAIGERTFREDLFYRLAVIEISIPALRDRRDDIVPLAEHFLSRAAVRAGKRIAGFSGAASKRLLSYDWPGNVRELENAVERAVALCDGDRIAPEDLPEALRTPMRTSFLESAAERSMTMTELGRAYAELVLKRAGGNKVRAATILGIDRRTLQRWFGDSDAAVDEEG